MSRFSGNINQGAPFEGSADTRQAPASQRVARASFVAGVLGVIAIGGMVAIASVAPLVPFPFAAWLLGLASAVAAIVLGVGGRRRSVRKTAGRRSANAGLAIGVIVLLASMVLLVGLLLFLAAFGCI